METFVKVQKILQTNTKLLAAIGLGLILIAGFLTSPSNTNIPWHTNSAGATHEIIVYKSATCGCCTIHADYMQANGYRVESVDTEELNAIKKSYNIPSELWSCHTTIVNDGEYFIEGHIPIEAIDELLEQEPDIAGIGMPGMPSGSPGMPGPKYGPFEVMQVNHDQEIDLYMSI